jgi:hypothetical protein
MWSAVCQNYSKLEGDTIFTSLRLLNLSQCNYISNLSDLCTRIILVDLGLVKPDYYHSPLIIIISLPFVSYVQNCIYSYRKFALGDFTLLYNIISTYTYDWSCVYMVPPLSMLLRQPQCCCSRRHGTGNSPWHHKL